MLRTSRDENLSMIADSVGFLVQSDCEVIFDAEHFFDGYRQDAKYAMQAVQAAAEAGARVIVLCDTNGGSMPSDVPRLPVV